MKEKIVIAAVSAMLSGAFTFVVSASNWAGRLTAIEGAVLRIEQRVDALAAGARK